MKHLFSMALPTAAMLLAAGCVAFNVGEPERYRLDRGKDGTILVTRQKMMSVGVFPAVAEENLRPKESVTPMVGWMYWRGDIYGPDLYKDGRFTTDPVKKEYCRFFTGILDTPYALFIAPWHGDYSCDTHYWEHGNVEKLEMFPADVRKRLNVKTWRDGGSDGNIQGLVTHSAWLGAHRFSTIVVEELDEGETSSRYDTAADSGNATEEEFARLRDDFRYRFHVESVEGKVKLANVVSANQKIDMIPDRTSVNAVLEKRAQANFGRGEDSIPLHISAVGNVAPIRATVTVWLDNKGDRRVSHLTYRDLEGGNYNTEENFLELIALGVVKALNRMTPEQVAKLRSRVHRTAEQRKALAWLTDSSAATFSVGADGGLFIESEHKFTPVPVDFAEMSKFPEIVGQSFDATTRMGKVVADITGCDENLAIDYLLGRLVPQICRTKAVVFDPVTAPPAGAQYRVDSYDRRTIDGKDFVTINFTALQ